jgi:superfamily II DNA or RNA helicase
MRYEGASDGQDSLLTYARQLCDQRLAAYREAPHDVEEHANIELSVLAGGYAYRQIAELVQNAADAVADAPDGSAAGRIAVLVDEKGLWASNTGAPLDAPGVKALLASNASGKRAGQIGRFGLGFKSLLKLGGRIAVLSRSVCLHFDPEDCRDRIRSALGLAAEASAPGLRLAEASTWTDGIGRTEWADRFDWAATIVFAELITAGAREAVLDEMHRFPSEFLLFLPGDVELVLKGPDFERHLRRRTGEDGVVSIEDLASESRASQNWKVFETRVAVTDEAALADATQVHARSEVPLIWAAPVGTGREVAGRFFAFFPTNTETRTLGILNAPWKLNSDRTALISGPWNAVLMEAAAELIASRLPDLIRDEDPGVVLDAFPRELATQSDVAAPLVQGLWTRLAQAPVLPNCDAELLHPFALWRAPNDSVELIRTWAAIAGGESCATHLHPSCTASPARIARLNQMAERLSEAAGPRLQKSDPVLWLEMAAADDPEGAVEALSLADAWAKTVSGYTWDSVCEKVRLILTDRGTLEAAPEVTLAQPPEPPLHAVHPLLLADPDARRILHERFGLRDDESTDWGRLLDARIAKAEDDGSWEAVWTVLRRIPKEHLSEALEYRTVFVRAIAGWSEPANAFRVGRLVGAEDLERESDTREALNSWLVDEGFHSRDGAILETLGVTDEPNWEWELTSVDVDATDAPNIWLWGWYISWNQRYWEKLGQRADRWLLRPRTFRMPCGWQLLLLANGRARSRITEALLGAVSNASAYEFGPVTFAHSTRPRSYTTVEYPHPLWSLLLEHGVLSRDGRELAFRPLLTSEGSGLAAAVPSLREASPALARVQAAGARWVSSREKARIWKDWQAYAAGEGVWPEELQTLYENAASDGVAPLQVCTPDGPRDLSEILVTAAKRDAEAARAAGLLAVPIPADVAELWIQNGARALSGEAKLEWTSPRDDAEAVAILDVEPALADILSAEATTEAGVLFVRDLCRRVREQRHDLEWAADQNRLLVSEDHFFGLGWAARVRLLGDACEAMAWLRDGADIEELLTSGAEARRRAVAGESDFPARLLAAVGGAQIICDLFEPAIAKELATDPQRAARVALTLFGPALLAESSIREAMSEQGLRPPERWGGEAAAEFVAALGFPADFAIAPNRRRDPELIVSGPIPLKPLHDYQEEVVRSLEALVSLPTSGRRRAVISLPTGAGKTRVAAETAVKRILAPEESPSRLVVWIAQSDELCEQAVQCFRELWSNLGHRSEALRIIRFWGGQANPQPPERGEPTVVVASIQTLDSRLIRAPLEWVSRPGLVVIDECHHALTTSYTGILKWFGREGPEGEPPIVGLSATPFRGRNEDETEQLARRFDGRLIPRDQGDLFDELQRRGVLAKFSYTKLEMERAFELTADEERHFETFKALPESALERLGLDKERNDKIIEAMASAEERSALVFATSVRHARRLAAHLNLLDVPAAVVSGETDRSSRRWFIKAFQAGDVRVLCNHSALTTGFDAPATDLIVIARPVFSPSLFMQMVGRGLRGPLNGGKETCRILTVQDNLDQYSGELAHHFFERYYLTS